MYHYKIVIRHKDGVRGSDNENYWIEYREWDKYLQQYSLSNCAYGDRDYIMEMVEFYCKITPYNKQSLTIEVKNGFCIPAFFYQYNIEKS